MENPFGEEVGRGRPSPDQTQNYFTQIGLKVRKALRMHRYAGLWERNEEGKRDWGNVSEHCLVETARVDAFSRLLKFSKDLQEDLGLAAAVSDFFKKQEKKIAGEVENTQGAYAEAEEKSLSLLKEAGFSERAIYLSGSAGTVESIQNEVPKLLKKRKLVNDEIAYLVLHYVDDYTIGSEWVAPVEILLNGNSQNALDRRITDAERRYPDLKKQGFFEKQKMAALQVEKRLSQIVSERTGKPTDSKKLPEMIDQEIIKKILE